MSEIKPCNVPNENPMTAHFCTCPVSQCPRHPSQHHQGCDPCIKDNLEKGKMPACMFKAVHPDVRGLTDFTMKGFVEFYLAHQPEESARLSDRLIGG